MHHARANAQAPAPRKERWRPINHNVQTIAILAQGSANNDGKLADGKHQEKAIPLDEVIEALQKARYDPESNERVASSVQVSTTCTQSRFEPLFPPNCILIPKRKKNEIEQFFDEGLDNPKVIHNYEFMPQTIIAADSMNYGSSLGFEEHMSCASTPLL